MKQLYCKYKIIFIGKGITQLSLIVRLSPIEAHSAASSRNSLQTDNQLAVTLARQPLVLRSIRQNLGITHFRINTRQPAHRRRPNVAKLGHKQWRPHRSFHPTQRTVCPGVAPIRLDVPKVVPVQAEHNLRPAVRIRGLHRKLQRHIEHHRPIVVFRLGTLRNSRPHPGHQLPVRSSHDVIPAEQATTVGTHWKVRRFQLARYG